MICGMVYVAVVVFVGVVNPFEVFNRGPDPLSDTLQAGACILPPSSHS